MLWDEFRKKHGLHDFTKLGPYMSAVLTAAKSFPQDSMESRERYQHLLEALSCDDINIWLIDVKDALKAEAGL